MIGRAAGLGCAAAAATLLLTACGSSGKSSTQSDAPGIPSGFKKTATQDYSFAVPGDWTVAREPVDDPDARQSIFYEVRGPGTDVNRLQMRVGAVRDYKSNIDLAAVQAAGELAVRRGAKRVGATQKIDVSGASDARRMDFTIPAGGDLKAAKVVTLLALTSNHTLVNVTIGGVDGDPSMGEVERVVKTVRAS